MELLSTHMCKEGDCGYHGNLFGGMMLAWLDEAAVAYACQICDTARMVTVSLDKVEFLKPVRHEVRSHRWRRRSRTNSTVYQGEV